jgi:hypothetical protein
VSTDTDGSDTMSDNTDRGPDGGADRGRRLAWRIGVGVIGIATATSSTPTADPPAAEQHDGSWGPWGGGHWGGGGPWGGFADAFGGMDIADISHATVVLAKDGGGSQTVLVQKGAVTSVNGGSIALKSADGYARTYTVTKDTKVAGDDEKISSVARDEQVVVVAKEGGDATVVVDVTDLGWK